MSTFRLPLPPSANVYWRHYRNHMVISVEARSYKDTARQLAYIAGVEPIDGDVKLSVDVYMINKRRDLDNALKVLGDSLNGVAFHDDNQVVEIHARRFQVPKAKKGVKREGYVLVTVEPLEAA